MPIKKTCGTCNHYKKTECHRNPPTATLYTVDLGCGGKETSVRTYWPSVDPDDTCGERKSKED